MSESDDTVGLRLLLVDDHEMVRKGLRMLLEAALGCDVDEASGALEALASIEKSPPDVVLLDARMPERDGIWTLQQIRERHESVPVIILSTYDSAEYVNGAIDNGAAGYLLKDANSQQLAEAIEIARHGRGLYLHPQVAQRLAGRESREVDSLPLSQRELEILDGLVAGRSTDEIAGALYMSPKTVKSHLTSLFRKLGVANRTQAVSKALRDGLVEHAPE